MGGVAGIGARRNFCEGGGANSIKCRGVEGGGGVVRRCIRRGNKNIYYNGIDNAGIVSQRGFYDTSLFFGVLCYLVMIMSWLSDIIRSLLLWVYHGYIMVISPLLAS